MAQSSQGYPRRLRLLKADDFSRVFSNRCCRKGHFLHVYAKPNQLPHARLGMIAAKKIVPTAVDRNFARRIIRESFRLSQTQLAAHDYVVRVARIILPQQALQAREELARLLERAGQCREF